MAALVAAAFLLKRDFGHDSSICDIEALLANEELADRVWEAWIAEKLTDGAACIARLLIVGLVSRRNH